MAFTSGAESNRTGSVAGRPVSAWARSHARRASRSLRSYVLSERRDPEPGGLAVVADELTAGLVAEDHRVGAAAVQQTEGDAGVAWMVDAPLSLDQHDV